MLAGAPATAVLQSRRLHHLGALAEGLSAARARAPARCPGFRALPAVGGAPAAPRRCCGPTRARGAGG